MTYFQVPRPADIRALEMLANKFGVEIDPDDVQEIVYPQADGLGFLPYWGRETPQVQWGMEA